MPEHGCGLFKAESQRNILKLGVWASQERVATLCLHSWIFSVILVLNYHFILKKKNSNKRHNFLKEVLLKKNNVFI